MKLFEIQKELENVIDAETGEILDIDAYKSLQMSESQKIENWVGFLKNTASDIEQLKAAEQSFRERRQALESRLKRSEKQFRYLTGEQPFSGVTGTVSYRESERVIITDKLAKKYMRVKYEADKVLLKELLKKGEKIKGASLETIKNLNIK